jgi:hypothetical protein
MTTPAFGAHASSSVATAASDASSAATAQSLGVLASSAPIAARTKSQRYASDAASPPAAAAKIAGCAATAAHAHSRFAAANGMSGRQTWSV